MKIKEAPEIIKEKEGAHDQYELAKLLKVSQGTISNYSKSNAYPTLMVAGYVYGTYGLQVEPFTKLALEKEWEWQKKNNDSL